MTDEMPLFFWLCGTVSMPISSPLPRESPLYPHQYTRVDRLRRSELIFSLPFW